MSEEYIVFQLAGRRPGWLDQRADWIAGLVRLEAGPLSPGEVREATRLGLSYTPTDLVVLDWAAGFVADTDCADTLQVIEFANVQLLEFRHIDDRLDDRLEAAYRLIRPERRRRRLPRFWRLHGDAVRQIREMEIEATSLFERVDNSLKLIGDHYLARVFEVASGRFHLRDWQQSIRRKLETVGRRLRPARPAGRRPADGGAGDHRGLADRAGDRRWPCCGIEYDAMRLMVELRRRPPATPPAPRHGPRRGAGTANRSGRRRPSARTGDDREHGDGQVLVADRRRPDRGEEPSDRRRGHRRRPNQTEIQPRISGELMSPKRWMRKMYTA